MGMPFRQVRYHGALIGPAHVRDAREGGGSGFGIGEHRDGQGHGSRLVETSQGVEARATHRRVAVARQVNKRIDGVL